MNWKEHIVEAFDRALSLGTTGEVRPKPQIETIELKLEQAPETDTSMFTPAEIRTLTYCEADEKEFKDEATVLLEECVTAVETAENTNLRLEQAPEERHHHSSWHRSYYIGKLRPVTSADYDAAIQRALNVMDKKKEAPKPSLLNTKVF